MCGIAGKLIFAREGQVTREGVLAMTGALAHRGPDGSGFHFARQIGLGHCRLDAGGHGVERQPIGNETGDVWATLDGEIYNARELRAQLQARGWAFCTKSSAEVIVRGYEEWGDRAVERLRGTFAFALWDATRERLLLARDRLGVQPLCYAVIDGRGFVFASEIRALLEDPEVSRDWDPVAVREYLTLGYVPAPATIFRRIVKLLPGHFLTVEHGRIHVRRYWDVPFATGKRRPEGEYTARLAELLTAVTRMQAADEETVTALLPPRPPSAALVATLAASQPSPVVATTVAFDAQPLAEVQQARAIAKHLGCRHRAELLTPRLPDLLPHLAWYFDEPFGDPAAITTYYLTSAARAQGAVAIGAAGSNEVWGGGTGSMEGRVRRWLGPPGFNAGLFGQVVRCSFRSRRLCSTEFLRETAGVDPLFSLRSARKRYTPRDRLARALYVDVKTRLADSVLTRIDRMSAAAGLRMRLPMVDHELVEFAATVPSRLKVRGGASHYLFRRLLDGRVPRALLQDCRYRFEPHPAAWLRGPLASMASDVLLSGRFRHRGLFDSKALTSIWQAHLTGRRDHHRELWSLLMLELWFQRVVDGGERRQRAA